MLRNKIVHNANAGPQWDSEYTRAHEGSTKELDATSNMCNKFIGVGRGHVVSERRAVQWRIKHAGELQREVVIASGGCKW